jgi:hypothetical protein
MEREVIKPTKTNPLNVVSRSRVISVITDLDSAGKFKVPAGLMEVKPSQAAIAFQQQLSKNDMKLCAIKGLLYRDEQWKAKREKSKAVPREGEVSK